jgi:hypothetical protein
LRGVVKPQLKNICLIVDAKKMVAVIIRLTAIIKYLLRTHVALGI